MSRIGVLDQLFLLRRSKVSCFGQLCVKSLKVNSMCCPPQFPVHCIIAHKLVHPVEKSEKWGEEGQSLFPDKVTVASCNARSHRSLASYLWLVPPLGYYLRFVFFINYARFLLGISFHFVSFRYVFVLIRVVLGRFEW